MGLPTQNPLAAHWLDSSDPLEFDVKLTSRKVQHPADSILAPRSYCSVPLLSPSYFILLREQILGPDAQSLSQLGEVDDRHISFAAFDAADVVTMQAGLKAQFLLRPTPALTKVS